MRSWVSLILCLFFAPWILAASLPEQSGIELAQLHPQLIWQRVSPTPQKPEGPVLYQIQLTLGQPNSVPKYDTSGRHFTASQILDNGTTVAIGGFSVNGSTGIVTFASSQTFPASGFPAPGGDVSGTLSALKVVGLEGVGVSSTLPINGQVLRFNGSNWAPATLAAGSGGTVTSITAGSGLVASPVNPITAAGTLSIPAAGVTNVMLQNSSLTVSAGPGLTGGGPVSLGNSTTLNLDTTFTDNRYAAFSGNTNYIQNLSGGTQPGASFNVSGNGAVSGTFALSATGTATAGGGFNSANSDWIASAFNSTASAAQKQTFRWRAEPAGNDTASPSGTLNLLFGSNGATLAETGLSIASNGQLTFASGQSFPGVLQLSGGTMTGNISFAGTQTFPGAVTAVNASSPLNSSGGSTPTISLNGIVPIANGGTGSGTKNFVDLSSGQTVNGNKTFAATTSFSSTTNLNGPVFFNSTVSFSTNTLLSFSDGAQYPFSTVATPGPAGGMSSPSEEFIASAHNGTIAQNQRFHWQVDATHNGLPNASGALNLSFASGGNGLSNVFGIDGTGKIASYGGSQTQGNGVASVIANQKFTAQSAAIGSMNLFTTGSSDGLFRVSIYAVTTTAETGGGTPTVTPMLSWTDDSGPQSKPVPGFTNLDLTALGTLSQATFVLQGKANDAVSFSTTISGSITNGQYSFYITAEQIM